MPRTLIVHDSDLVAEGSQRWVYRHPDDRSKLVKVLRPQAQTAGRAALATTTERLFPSIRRRWARKEYMEYLRLMLTADGPDFHAPISHMLGFAMTQHGLGCLTEAVTDGEGLGQTLTDLTDSNTLNPTDLALFNDTIMRIYRYDVRAGDMTPRNFVFGQRGDARECVLVDGFGDIHAIPIRSAGRWANQLGMDDNCKRLAQKTGLLWDSKTRNFHMN